MNKLILYITILITFATTAFAEKRISLLHIGDSLSLGGFGTELYNNYVQKYGKDNVVFYSSCGSSPESYLKEYRNYFTKCGFKSRTPTEYIYKDFQNGRAPAPTLTPKLENLIEKYHPKKIIVQLGTNWMDEFSQSRGKTILQKFSKSLTKENASITWILPPDSSHYSKKVQQNVRNLILSGDPKFKYIHSEAVTRYTSKSGGDGIHFNDREGKIWAKAIIPKL